MSGPLFWLVAAAAKMQSNVPVVPLNKSEVNADFVAVFWGRGGGLCCVGSSGWRLVGGDVMLVVSNVSS